MKLKLRSNSAAETVNYGKLFSKVLKGSDLVLLVGALGGGKTTFTRGILQGLGYRGKVLSPSFTLEREYRLRNKKVYHLDLYRLDKEQALNLGLDDFVYSKNSLTLIEWGDRIDKEFDKYIAVEFSYLASESRKISISTVGLAKLRLAKIQKILTK